MVQSIWPDWEIVERIGEGSFGSVFRAQRKDIVGVAEAAIKVASIPQSSDELESLQMEGLTPEQSRTYLESVVQDLTTEIRMMERVKGYTNIVTIEDYKVVKHKDRLLWNIFIRMELLKPLNRAVAERPMTEDEVIRLGEDLCSALVVCRKKRIVHRDIKPENIFVNEDGDYKLGDFGVARSLERLTTVLTRKGTYNYMAPEVFNQTVSETDIVTAARVDICSLGLVLYQLMNKGRLPFIPDKQLPTPTDRQNAIVRRMKGEPIPPPSQASEALSRVILKACAFRSEDRFDTAEDMRDALRRVAAGEPLDLSGPEAPAPEPTAEPPARKEPRGSGSGMDLEDIEDGMSPAPDPEKALPPREHINDSGWKSAAGDFSTPEAGNASPAPPPKRRSPFVPVLAAALILALLGGAGWFALRPRGNEGPILAQASPAAETAAPVETDAGSADASEAPEASVETSAVTDEASAPSATIEANTPEASAEATASATNTAATASAEAAVELSAMPESSMETSATPEATPDPATPVRFASEAIEAAARNALGKAEGDLTAEELAGIEKLDLSERSLTDLSDLAVLTGLKQLHLEKNNIADLTPLAGLTLLTGLDLSYNSIADLAPLTGLRNLNTLSLVRNELTGIDALADLTRLTRLYLGGNDITDVTPLAGLTELKALYIDGNPRLTDTTPLEGLTGLTAYRGPMPAWPEGRAAIVVCLREDDASDLFDAVARAFMDMGLWEQVSLGSAATSAENSLAFASSLCSGGIQDADGAAVSADAILLFPHAGVDYAGACARALTHGIPIHTFKGQTQAEVYDEVRALYGSAGEGNPFR